MSRSYALSINALFVFDMYDLIRALFLKVSFYLFFPLLQQCMRRSNHINLTLTLKS